MKIYNTAKLVKLKNILIIVLFFSNNLCFSQLGQPVLSYDKTNIDLMKSINKLLKKNIAANKAIIESNNKQRAYLEKELKIGYQKTGYDVLEKVNSNNNDIFTEVEKVKNKISRVLSKDTTVLLPHKGNIIYFNKLSSDGSIGIDFELNHSSITQSNKQEFYQLRRKVLDVYNKRYETGLELKELFSKKLNLMDSLLQKQF